LPEGVVTNEPAKLAGRAPARPVICKGSREHPTRQGILSARSRQRVDAIEADATGIDVVHAHDACGIGASRVQDEQRAVGDGTAAQALLKQAAGALRSAVLAETSGLQVLCGTEGLFGRFAWGPQHQLAEGVEGTIASAQPNPALCLRHAQLHVNRPRYRKVALARIVNTLADTQRVHGVRDQEAEIRIALAMQMRRQIDGQPPYTQLEVLAVVGVETTQHVVVRHRRALSTAHVHARSRAQQLCSFRSRRRGQHVTPNVEVTDGAVLGAPLALTVDRDLEQRLSRPRSSSGRRTRGGLVGGGGRPLGSGARSPRRGCALTDGACGRSRGRETKGNADAALDRLIVAGGGRETPAPHCSFGRSVQAASARCGHLDLLDRAI
jgi:hypothetical protein